MASGEHALQIQLPMGKDNKSETANLRQKAEELIKKNPSKSSSIIVQAEMQKIMHELEVHQIELEMQNDELTFVFRERERVDKSLKASESRYRRLFESAKDGILILDAETGMITDVNPFLIEMLGFSKHQFLDKAIWEIGFFNDIIANLDKFSELQQKEYLRYDDLPLQTADGRKISVEFVSNIYFENNKKVIQCNIRETTIRKQSELALRKSETHLRTLVQTIPDLIWVKDTKGVYITCNTMFERFFGAREADIVGKTDYDFVDHELADFFRANDNKAMEAGKPTSNEEWVTFADDGHRVFLDTIKTPMYDSDGMLIGVLGIGRDITSRMLAEQKVKEGKERFRAIFDQAPIAIALVDLQGYPIISNLPLTKMLGYSSDELAKMKFTEFTYPEDIDKDLNQFSDLIAGKISGYNMEKRFIHKNGNMIWANLFVTILNDNNGLPQEIIGMVEDITEHKKIENEITFQADLLSNVGQAVIAIDMLNNVTYWNRAAEKIYGWSSSEAVGQNIDYLIPSQPTKKQIKEISKEISKGHSWTGEFLVNRKDHNSFPAWVTFTPIFDSKGELIGVMEISSDITERKKAEEEIAMLSHSLKSINECICITDLDDKILFVNESFLHTYGYEPGELIGKHIGIVRALTNENSKVDEILPATILGEWQGELFQKRKDGSEFPVSLSTTRVKDKEDKIIGLIGVATEITDRKRAENELIAAKEKAEESDRLKSAFLANMSHEVRTPLNSIIGFSELLADPDFEEDQKNEFIQQIISNGNNLLNIISDIMDISKMESGEITLRKKHINAQKYVSGVYEQFSFQAGTHKLELIISLPDNDEETVIFADAERLMQIFNNLIGNALKFTSEGKIEIGYQPKGKMVEFFVKDTGIGIPAEYHDHIFERFRQVEGEKTRKYGGNGLGLAITKNLVELMGGKIWLESKVGEGSKFYFTLPRN